MKHLLKLSAAAIIATTAAASAATYTVDGLINDTYDGFRSSLIHEQSYNGDMSVNGDERTFDFDAEVGSGGVWNSHITDADNISFSGSLEGGDIKYKASGNLNTEGGGFLAFLFDTGREIVNFTFKFDENLNMGPANSFADGVISLWGETGTCVDPDFQSDQKSECLGMDLRIAVSPSQVPLPASALLLLAGLGGMATMRRKS